MQDDPDRYIYPAVRKGMIGDDGNVLVLKSADFLYLLRNTGLTRGNLSAHMRKLESAGYVDVEKTFVDRLPLTVFRLTRAGRTALRKYRKQMTSGLSVVD